MGKVTLISGASRGIGRAIADRLARDGHEIINISRSQPAKDFPGESFSVDLSDPIATQRALSEIVTSRSVDNLVNNAASSAVALLGEIELGDIDRMVGVNLKATIQVTQAVLPSMQLKKTGRIVNIGSRASYGKVGRSVYGGTKAALSSMTRTWALELGRDGITVNAIAPGPIATEIFFKDNPSDEPATKSLLGQIPVGRIGEPEDVAAAVAFFLSAEASFITGQTLNVCGGLSVYSAPL